MIMNNLYSTGQEGYKRNGTKDKLRFYNISQGSMEECRYYLILSQELGYGQSNELESLLEKSSQKLYYYIKTIKGS